MPGKTSITPEWTSHNQFPGLRRSPRSMNWMSASLSRRKSCTLSGKEADTQGSNAETYRSFQMNLMQFSVFLRVDLEKLRLAVALSDEVLQYNYIVTTESLLATYKFLQLAWPLQSRSLLPLRNLLILCIAPVLQQRDPAQ